MPARGTFGCRARTIATSRRRPHPALIFLLVIGLIVGGLASWTSNNLTTPELPAGSQRQYALSSATQVLYRISATRRF